jgi:hydroxymethylpyrimidine/phosphomethylpyrimidine kinase
MSPAVNSQVPVVLAIGGFDPSAGAGIAGDLKTVAAHNCYGVAAITALTVQNTNGVSKVYPVDPALLKETISAVLADGRVKAVKIGMLANQANVAVVSEFLDANPGLPAVLDPVLRSATNAELLDAKGLAALRASLLSRVTVVTPNLDEAAALTDLKVENQEGMKAAATKLIEMGARAVVVTGGHLEKAADFFLNGSGGETFSVERVKPDNTHGTGCAFSTAIAANLANGRQLQDAVVMAKAYVTEAIRKAYPAGPGRIPLNHLFRMQQPLRVVDHEPAIPEPAH